MKNKCQKCNADNESTLVVTKDFKPMRYFECSFCKTKNFIDIEKEQDNRAMGK